MIGRLRGHLLESEGNMVTLDVGGVGYEVAAPLGTLGRATADAAGAVTLHVHTHVREDAIVLYGFAHADERRCFEALLGAHGVGPALAMAILSALTPAALSTAVIEDDVDTLCLVPGVGKKTAARLLLELKARLDLPVLDGPTGGAATGTARADARAALVELGYGAEEIAAALEGADPGAGAEDLIRAALRDLAGRR